MTEDYFAQACFRHSKEDAALFESWTKHLPLREATTPFHSGPHSIRALWSAVHRCKPQSVLEIGFCLGHSASMFLELRVPLVVSIDNSDRPETLDGARRMKEKFGDRFSFFNRSDFNRSDFLPFDAVFIDGGHEEKDVLEDIGLARVVKAEWFIFDDWFPCWGPGVRSAIVKSKLVPVGIFGNVALCVEDSHFDQ